MPDNEPNSLHNDAHIILENLGACDKDGNGGNMMRMSHTRYGALGDVQRLELSSGRWSDLPPLKPVNRHHPLHHHHQHHYHYCLHHHHDDDDDDDQVRAQHGCALVELMGESGMLVVGGDSGGTRLNDVRFVYIYSKYKNPGFWWWSNYIGIGHTYFHWFGLQKKTANDSI